MRNDYEDESKQSRSKKKTIVAAAICFLYGATSLAANITLNTNDRVEFGQGVFYLSACDNYIPIYIGKSSDGTLVNRIYLDGINTNKCANKSFLIELTAGGTESADLYDYTETQDGICTSVKVANRVRFALNLSGEPYLIAENNQKVLDDSCTKDYINISTIDLAKGKFLITFVSPKLAANLLTGIRIQSY